MVALRSRDLALDNGSGPDMGWRALVEGTTQPIEDDIDVCFI